MGNIRVPAINASTAATTSGISIWLGPDDITRVSVHAEYGAITGTFTVYASNDPRARCDHPDYASADWVDKTASWGLANPAGVAGDFIEEFENVNYEFLRIAFTLGAGASYLRVQVSGRS